MGAFVFEEIELANYWDILSDHCSIFLLASVFVIVDGDTATVKNVLS